MTNHFKEGYAMNMKGIMKALTLCVLISLFIMGCGKSVKYTHPTKDSYEYDGDVIDCMEEARQYAVKVGAKDNILLISTQTEQCLKNRGWVKVTK